MSSDNNKSPQREPFPSKVYGPNGTKAEVTRLFECIWTHVINGESHQLSHFKKLGFSGEPEAVEILKIADKLLGSFVRDLKEALSIPGTKSGDSFLRRLREQPGFNFLLGAYQAKDLSCYLNAGLISKYKGENSILKAIKKYGLLLPCHFGFGPLVELPKNTTRCVEGTQPKVRQRLQGALLIEAVKNFSQGLSLENQLALISRASHYLKANNLKECEEFEIRVLAITKEAKEMGPIPTPGESQPKGETTTAAEKEVEEEKKCGQEKEDVDMEDNADERQEVFAKANNVAFDQIGEVDPDVYGTHVYNKAIAEHIFASRNIAKKQKFLLYVDKRLQVTSSFNASLSMHVSTNFGLYDKSEKLYVDAAPQEEGEVQKFTVMLTANPKVDYAFQGKNGKVFKDLRPYDVNRAPYSSAIVVERQRTSEFVSNGSLHKLFLVDEYVKEVYTDFFVHHTNVEHFIKDAKEGQKELLQMINFEIIAADNVTDKVSLGKYVDIANATLKDRTKEVIKFELEEIAVAAECYNYLAPVVNDQREIETCSIQVPDWVLRLDQENDKLLGGFKTPRVNFTSDPNYCLFYMFQQLIIRMSPYYAFEQSFLVPYKVYGAVCFKQICFFADMININPFDFLVRSYFYKLVQLAKPVESIYELGPNYQLKKLGEASLKFLQGFTSIFDCNALMVPEEILPIQFPFGTPFQHTLNNVGSLKGQLILLLSLLETLKRQGDMQVDKVTWISGSYDYYCRVYAVTPWELKKGSLFYDDIEDMKIAQVSSAPLLDGAYEYKAEFTRTMNKFLECFVEADNRDRNHLVVSLDSAASLSQARQHYFMSVILSKQLETAVHNSIAKPPQQIQNYQAVGPSEDLLKLRKENEKLLNKYKRRREENKQFKTTVKAMQGEQSTIRRKLDDFTQEVSVKDGMIQEMKDKILAREDKIKELETRMDKMQLQQGKEKEKVAKEIAALQEKVNEYKKLEEEYNKNFSSETAKVMFAKNIAQKSAKQEVQKVIEKNANQAFYEMICSCLSWLQGYINGAGPNALKQNISKIKMTHMMSEYTHQYKTMGTLGRNLPPMDYLTAVEALTRLYPDTFHLSYPGGEEKGFFLMVTKKLNQLTLYRAALEMHFKKNITPPIQVLTGQPIQLYDLDKQELNLSLAEEKPRVHFTYVRCGFGYNNQDVPTLSIQVHLDSQCRKEIASYISIQKMLREEAKAKYAALVAKDMEKTGYKPPAEELNPLLKIKLERKEKEDKKKQKEEEEEKKKKENEEEIEVIGEVEEVSSEGEEEEYSELSSYDEDEDEKLSETTSKKKKKTNFKLELSSDSSDSE